MRRLQIDLDALGGCASILCLIHCLAFPVLLAALPSWNAFAKARNANAGPATATRSPVGEGPQLSVQPCCANGACRVGAHAAASSTTTAATVTTERTACCSTPTDFWIHVGLLAAVAPLGVVAWVAGYRRHRRPEVLALGVAGVSLLTGALLFGPQLLSGRGEQFLTMVGSLCMVAAHLWNRHQCRCCHPIDRRHLVQLEPAASTPLLPHSGVVGAL